MAIPKPNSTEDDHEIRRRVCILGTSCSPDDVCPFSNLFPQRAEPVGYDREQNAYWLIGGKRVNLHENAHKALTEPPESRLWIQRAPPKPPTRKRKRKAPADDEIGRAHV